MTGSEELLKLRKKLGEEKFEMAIQMYNYFEDVLGKLAVEGEAASATTNDEQTNHLIDQLQQEVYELRSRVLVYFSVDCLWNTGGWSKGKRAMDDDDEWESNN